MKDVKRCIFRTAIKILFFVLIVIISQVILKTPLITNQVALGQMYNSNDAYLLMETAKWIKPAVNLIILFIAVCLVISVAKDIYKIVKKNNK